MIRAFGLLLALALPAAAQEIADARYAEPTARYPHGALGDPVEHAALEVLLADGRVLSVVHAPGIVFEDTAPRLLDVDGDGMPEIVTVEAHERQGARLAVWGVEDGALGLLAATPWIGTRFRWLAPLGAADLDGDGAVELAYVDRPHLARTLRVWRWTDGGLVPVASLPGVTNHRYGDPEIPGGIRDCGTGPEMILSDAGWARVLAVTLEGGTLSARDLGRWSDGALAEALRC